MEFDAVALGPIGQTRVSLRLRFLSPARRASSAALIGLFFFGFVANAAEDKVPTEADLLALEMGPESIPAASHTQGKKPKTPATTLPSGAPRAPESGRARNSIREAPLPEEELTLRALRRAEEALFPQPLPGISAGFSWDVPVPNEGKETLFGLPGLFAPVGAPEPGLDQAEIEWLRSLTLPDLPVRFDSRVVTYLKFYRDSPRGRAIAAIWARRSGRFVPAIQAELRRASLPSDLVWLSLIESGHDPLVKSPAGAVGLWQFLPESGRLYGLTVDAWVDERRDPIASTRSAIRFLSDLYQRFGNWELCMAAYNMGYAGLSRSLTKYNTNSYWVLSRLESGIPWETALYVPKIFALAIVMNNRSAFGLDRVTPDVPIAFDTISVEPGTSLSEIAQLASSSLDELRALNPMLIRDRVAPSSKGQVRVPRGQGAKVLAQLPRTRNYRTVRLRYGENIASLAAEYEVKEGDVLGLNRFATGERIEPGTVILLPERARKQRAESLPPTIVVPKKLLPGPSQKLVYYEVQAGDILEEIASELGLSANRLAWDNALDVKARLRGGMILQALVPAERDLSAIRVIRQPGPVLLGGSPEFHEHFEALRGYRRIEVTAKKGDTLASIGRRYGVTPGSMERINHRSQSTPLAVGETIIVYTQLKDESASSSGAVSMLPELSPVRPELLP